jgi:glucose-1-phosphate adenylyltransferase
MLEDALLSPGCDVAGTVRRSVLSPGVVVEPGAEVVDSVLLYDVVVRTGARVQRAVWTGGSRSGIRAWWAVRARADPRGQG